MNKFRMKGAEWINKVNSCPICKWEWLVVIILGLYMFVALFYADLVIIYNHSLTFLDSLFGMDLANFYANTLAKRYDGFGAVYYWTVYAVVGAWNLPIWILNKLFGINVFSIKCLLWCRLEIIVFLILAVHMLQNILMDFGYTKEKYRFVQFMFVSSLWVILPTVGISQVDIIAVFLMLWGIREYLRTDKITWKFLLIFSFAASLKIFALFIFIPLVFLREKRILAVLWDMFVGCWFILASLIPYAWREDYVESTSILNNAMVERLFRTSFPGGNTDIPIFVVLLVGICIWAYMKKITEKNEYFVYVTWIAACVFAAFFTFVFSHPYWIILLAPYVVILVIINTPQMKVNIILEFIMSVSATIFYCASFGVYLTETNFSYLILPRLGYPTNASGYGSFKDAITAWGVSDYLPVVFAVFVACLVAFLVINRPDRLVAEVERAGEENLAFDHGMIFLRLLMIVVYVFMGLYIGYIN